MTNSVLESIEDGTYFMRMGTSELSNAQSGTRRKVLKAFKHPEYKSVPYFDAAIYQSDIDIEFTKWVMPICLPMRPIDDDDAFAGKYRRIGKTPRPLLYLELEYSSRKMQKNILCYLVKSQIQL